MFVKFINKELGNAMYVHESRVDEYKEVGHKPASNDAKKTSNRAKRTTRKTAK